MSKPAAPRADSIRAFCSELARNNTLGPSTGTWYRTTKGATSEVEHARAPAKKTRRTVARYLGGRHVGNREGAVMAWLLRGSDKKGSGRDSGILRIFDPVVSWAPAGMILAVRRVVRWRVERPKIPRAWLPRRPQ